MWQHTLNIVLALMLITASLFTLGVVNFMVSGIIMSAGILIAGLALWGVADDMARYSVRSSNKLNF
jgi:membrane protein implicated in regulation of membrane protease activity